MATTAKLKQEILQRAKDKKLSDVRFFGPSHNTNAAYKYGAVIGLAPNNFYFYAPTQLVMLKLVLKWLNDSDKP